MNEIWVPVVNLPKDTSKIPNGYIEENGKTIYIDGNGDKHTRDQYIEEYGIDPESYVEAMRKIPPIRVGGKVK